MTEPNFSIYKKPEKSQYERTFDEQAKAKPKRLWPGKTPYYAAGQVQNDQNQDDDDDDDIFDLGTAKDQNYVSNDQVDEQQVEQPEEQQSNMQQNRQQIHSMEQEDCQEQNFEVEEVDQEVLLRRRRATKMAQDEPILSNQNEQIEKELKKKKKKEKKEEKKKRKQMELEQIMEQEIDDNDEEEVEEEQRNVITMLKPVFVSRDEREKLDHKWEEDIRLKEEKQKNLERKQFENRMILIQSAKTNEVVENENDSDAKSKQDLPNDEDDEQEDGKEYTLWKIRELKRLRSEHDDRTRMLREKAEIERRRNLSDEQRIEEDFKLGSDKTSMQEQTKYVFMQKYYHKGAYFQDKDDPIFNRNYNVPVGEDLWDKSQLPQILQKRRGIYGKRGQSKYTHLTDQDTTNYDPEYQADENIRQKLFLKQAGNKDINKFEQFFKNK